MERLMSLFRPLLLAGGLALALGACATLRELVQPPVFQVAEGRTSELRLLGPSTSRPLGGAAIRIWTRVENPNTFGLTLNRLAGSLLLEGEDAAELDLPLGLPLTARQDTIIPLDLSVSFSNLPELAGALRDALTRNAVAYRLVGTVTVDGGPLGDASFGPSTLLSGQLRVLR
jgi:hypothetical protein